ncbi:hypothetical protein GGI35DRAFT_303011 [Trichoderma velutinum]
MQIRSPQHLTSNIDIVDRAASFGHPENHTHGALVSIDLNCPADFFFGRKDLVAKFSLYFTTEIQGGFHKPIAIQHAVVGYFRADNNIKKLVQGVKPPPLNISGAFGKGEADIEIHHPNDSKSDGSCSIRIVALLDAYPSNMEVSASLSIYTLPNTDGNIRHSRTFVSSTDPRVAPSPNEERLQRLLCWTAALGYEKLFGAYLDQGPSMLDVEDEFGMTPLSCAAYAGKISVIQLALQQGGCDRARRKTARGHSPLEAAAFREDTVIFHSFLKLLKYFEGLGSATPPANIPQIEDMPGLEDRDIQTELDSAAFHEQKETVRNLVEMLLASQIDKENWLAHQMVQAAKKGDLCLVQVLKICKAEVDTEAYADIDRGNEEKTTPLMIAIEHARIAVAEFLISHGAGNEDALRAAVERKQHTTIRALLQAGVRVKGELKKNLRTIAAANRDSTTLMLLKVEKGTGKLASWDQLDSIVDEQFTATVVNFVQDRDPDFKELTVHELMQKPDPFFSLSGNSKFKWFHLPANNMKWAEALIGKIYHYDPSLVYKVLEPKRWVKRQHKGETDSPHARFMLPACHDFSEAFIDKTKYGNEQEDKHVVLFMPYLHWDEEAAMKTRTYYLAERLSGTTFYKDRVWNDMPETELRSKREKMLMEKYLLSDDDNNAKSRHVLHIRRTLDQSLYHNLKDTIFRDSDQTVHRYQNELNKKKLNKKKPGKPQPLSVIMVDQLWMWILVGKSGKAEAIVSCFPSRDWLDVGITTSDKIPARILDGRRTTDVLQITKSYIQHRPSAIKTPYDLAGVIASRCSRALLDHSTDMLNFAEVYENSISYIMNEETVLFNRFNTLMKTRTQMMNGFKEESSRSNSPIQPKQANSYQDLAKIIMEDKQWLEEQKEGEIPEISVDHCKKYRQYTLETEIPSVEEIESLKTNISSEKKNIHLIKLLEKFGRFFVLDITREITLLSQIKDIQDELEMMEKIFIEQKEVLQAMDRIIQNMQRSNSHLNDQVNIGKSDTRSDSRSNFYDKSTQSNFHEEIHDDSNIYDNFDRGSGIFGDTDSLSSNGKAQQKKYSTQSIIWGLGHQKQNLPLRTVSRHSKQIQKMVERAKSTNSALANLVDLKQKQNNMIDTRTARLQAEQSHIMTIQAGRQSKTLMVFTFVTILFLPLSFIAAFFAIPAKEFGPDNLTLGFVSKITFPLSIGISILIIVIGISASRWPLDKVPQRLFTKFHRLRRKLTRNSGQNNDVEAHAG